jgi:MOSC domain-containing protein YiiM
MKTSTPKTMAELFATLPQRGTLRWIGLRPAREQPMQATERAVVEIGGGLIGDRYRGNADSKRQVTLIQAEHLVAVGSLLGRQPIDPALVRRNLVVSGINLLALHRARFHIGEVLLEGTGLCQPCSKMESSLGAGGYNAMRGHGGITARVITPGQITLGDEVRMAPVESRQKDWLGSV